jgi:hypothetical protein
MMGGGKEVIMKLGKDWIVVVVMVGLLLAGLSATALAYSPGTGTGTAEGDSWEEMYFSCHGEASGTYFNQVSLDT